MSFERLDASIAADARPQRQRRRPEFAGVERNDPGKRMLKYQTQDLLVALRSKDVR